MYYFGTNLDERFHVPDFWPTKEQSHQIPKEKADIKAEITRIQQEIRDRKMQVAKAQSEGEGG
jgi:protein PET100, fungi type